MDQQRKVERLARLEDLRGQSKSIMKGPLGSLLSRSFEFISKVVGDGAANTEDVAYAIEEFTGDCAVSYKHEQDKNDPLRQMTYELGQAIGMMVKEVIEKTGAAPTAYLPSAAAANEQNNAQRLEFCRSQAISRVEGPLGKLFAKTFEFIAAVVKDGVEDSESILYLLEVFASDRALTHKFDKENGEPLRQLVYGLVEAIGALVASMMEERAAAAAPETAADGDEHREPHQSTYSNFTVKDEPMDYDNPTPDTDQAMSAQVKQTGQSKEQQDVKPDVQSLQKAMQQQPVDSSRKQQDVKPDVQSLQQTMEQQDQMQPPPQPQKRGASSSSDQSSKRRRESTGVDSVETPASNTERSDEGEERRGTRSTRRSKENKENKEEDVERRKSKSTSSSVYEDIDHAEVDPRSRRVTRRSALSKEKKKEEQKTKRVKSRKTEKSIWDADDGSSSSSSESSSDSSDDDGDPAYVDEDEAEKQRKKKATRLLKIEKERKKKEEKKMRRERKARKKKEEEEKIKEEKKKAAPAAPVKATVTTPAAAAAPRPAATPAAPAASTTAATAATAADVKPKVVHLKCKDCNRVFDTSAGLGSHTQRQHWGVKCEVCNKRFSHDKIGPHQEKDHADWLAAKAAKNATVKDDNNPATAPSQSVVPPKPASSTTTAISSASAGTATVKLEIPAHWKCDKEKCGRVFTTQKGLQHHQHQHFGVPCPYCTMRLTEEKLPGHVEKSHPDKKKVIRVDPIACPQCKVVQVSKAALDDHILKAHPPPPPPPETPTPTSSETSTPASPATATSSSIETEETSLPMDLSSFDPMPTPTPSSDANSYECKTCGSKFDRRVKLLEHLLKKRGHVEKKKEES